MGRADAPGRGAETGSSTTELVGACVAVAALVLAMSSAFGAGGGDLGERMAERLHRLLAQGPAAQGPARAAGEGDSQRPVATHAAVQGRWRSWHERHGGGGSQPVRVKRDELRLTPIVDERAVRSATWQAHRTGRHGDATIRARACTLCTGLEWRHEVRPGATADAAGRRVGVDARVRAEGRLALLATEAGAGGRLRVGPGEASAHGRVRGTVGLEGDAEARARLGAGEQDLELRAGAMAGASVRAEARVGVDMLGVAIRQSARAEGWAGAGARGAIGVRRTASRVEWRFGWGAALGLGGATEWSGSIDVSDVPERHRRRARDALAIAMRGARLVALPPPRPLLH